MKYKNPVANNINNWIHIFYIECVYLIEDTIKQEYLFLWSNTGN